MSRTDYLRNYILGICLTPLHKANQPQNNNTGTLAQKTTVLSHNNSPIFYMSIDIDKNDKKNSKRTAALRPGRCHESHGGIIQLPNTTNPRRGEWCYHGFELATLQAVRGTVRHHRRFIRNYESSNTTESRPAIPLFQVV